MNILTFFIIVFYAIIGGGSTLAIIIAFFATLCFKIYRKIKYGISLYD